MTEHKQFKKDVIARTTTQLANSIVTDLHSLSKTVKAGSKAVAEVLPIVSRSMPTSPIVLSWSVETN